MVLYIFIIFIYNYYKQTKDLTRKAGLLLNKRSGRQINYGLVLEDLIVTKGEKVIRQVVSRTGKRNSPTK